MAALGFELDPYSILVPFLVFAIGVSHGAQKMNGIMQDIGRGAHRLVAARYTFRRLFLAGLTALLADAVGFAVLMVIDIPVIQDLALTASIGVAVLIFTNLILLPVLLSYVGVSDGRGAAQRCSAEATRERARLRPRCGRCSGASSSGAGRSRAVVGGGRAARSAASLVEHAAADRRPRPGRARAARRLALQPRQRLHHRPLLAVERHLRGDREDARRKAASKYATLVEADRLAWTLQQVPGVQTTVALTNAVRQITAGSNEGSPKWLTIARNQDVLNYGAQQASVNNPDLFNTDCSVMPVIAYLADHRPRRSTASSQASADVRRRAQHRRAQVPARRRQRRHRGRDQHRRAQGLAADAAAGLRRGDRAVLHHLPQLARGGGARWCRWSSPRCCARR